MNYAPHTSEDLSEMLKTVGAASVEDLFSDIKPEFRAKSFKLQNGISEFEVFEYLKKLSGKNSDGFINFIGGGFYNHYIPAAVDALSGRAEFYTAYTPYQPECAQGTLQALYEYQTAICRITGMDAANASVYDGGTALAEAVIMALRITRRGKVIIDAGVNPGYREIIKTYTANISCKLLEVDPADYRADRKKIFQMIDEETAAVVFQNPNFFGTVDDYTDIVSEARSKGALAVSSVYPVSLGLLKTTASMGADIATGEGQSLGNPLNFGGPYLGFMAVTEKYMRNLPGRIVGTAYDKNGNRGFVLTLQAREQHIRRQKAASNICSNQNLCAIRAIIYLACLGKKGFEELARKNHSKAMFAEKLISGTGKAEISNKNVIFNEFAVRFGMPAEKVYKALLKKGIFAGIPLGRFYKNMKNEMLVCVTEKTKKEEISAFADSLNDYLSRAGKE